MRLLDAATSAWPLGFYTGLLLGGAITMNSFTLLMSASAVAFISLVLARGKRGNEN